MLVLVNALPKIRQFYGLAWSARQFYVKLVEELKSCGFHGSLVNPCLWVERSTFGVVMIDFYVDDCLTIGTEDSIQEVLEDIISSSF